MSALGPGVEGPAVGQRVAALTLVGSYATHVVADAGWIVETPEGPSAGVVTAVILMQSPGKSVCTALLDLARASGKIALSMTSPRSA